MYLRLSKLLTATRKENAESLVLRKNKTNKQTKSFIHNEISLIVQITYFCSQSTIISNTGNYYSTIFTVPKENRCLNSIITQVILHFLSFDMVSSSETSRNHAAAFLKISASVL